ncbi:ribulose-phosphate 3-epimerase [Carnobacterium iners]|uniref:Ribulose-phosphate 3-epimerase n=1 Tax=Carnobacterium iners TaxID=1073423 RepID=A0A1X7NCV8_9LACT|nr:helix-turn-helix domain-containing protein [Carnobacterium iners]SEK36063.1 ribulose-phosphate 3-epimerase [Carnobacterium iners]SMH35448.1 ribulose-phosphate 3-epimerase [Carnobacterium iners]
MNRLSYLDYFYLSLFSKTYSKKASTIYHIFTGKKTASILYSAERYHLTYVFALFPKLNRSQFNKSIEKLAHLNHLSQSGEKMEYYLSDSGEKESVGFFNSHYYPKQLNYLQNGLALNHFWRTLQLITQVLSEVRHKNKLYTPIEKEWEKQYWLKLWLKKSNKDKQELAVIFGNEWILILNELPLINAEILTANLSGHNNTGKTQNQLAEAYKKEAIEVHLIVLDSLACIGKIIEQYPKKTPLFFSIYKEMLQTHVGTTTSAILTKQYLLGGYSVEDTAKYRQLKLSTINEHVIEISIMDPLFDLSAILPLDRFKEIEQLLKETPALTYQEMLEKKPEVLFLWFRLAQIERNRNSDE